MMHEIIFFDTSRMRQERDPICKYPLYFFEFCCVYVSSTRPLRKSIKRISLVVVLASTIFGDDLRWHSSIVRFKFLCPPGCPQTQPPLSRLD